MKLKVFSCEFLYGSWLMAVIRSSEEIQSIPWVLIILNFENHSQENLGEYFSLYFWIVVQ